VGAIIRFLKAVARRVQGSVGESSAYPGMWIRLAGGASLRLADRSVQRKFWQEIEQRRGLHPEDCKTALRQAVAADRGQKGIKAYDKAIDLGLPPEDAAAQAIAKVKLPPPEKLRLGF